MSLRVLGGLVAIMALQAWWCIGLAHLNRRANILNSELASMQADPQFAPSSGSLRARTPAPGMSRAVRAYAPLFWISDAASTAATPGANSVLLVFAPTAESAERTLMDDAVGRRISRLLIAGVLVDIMPGTLPSVDATGNVRVRVQQSALYETAQFATMGFDIESLGTGPPLQRAVVFGM